MNLVKLTKSSDEEEKFPVWVDMDKVLWVAVPENDEGNCEIRLPGESLFVENPVRDVVAMWEGRC